MPSTLTRSKFPLLTCPEMIVVKQPAKQQDWPEFYPSDPATSASFQASYQREPGVFVKIKTRDRIWFLDAIGLKERESIHFEISSCDLPRKKMAGKGKKSVLKIDFRLLFAYNKNDV